MAKPLLFLPPLAFAAIALAFAIGLQRDEPDSLPSVFEGRAAPAISPEPLAGLPTFDRDALDAPGVKIVNFWASWCAPCRAEHPALMELAEDYTVYGVNRDRTAEEAIGFLEDLGNPFEAVIYDPRNRKSIDWGVYGLPETFVIDGEGKVVLRFAGPIHRVMDTVIQEALDEAAE